MGEEKPKEERERVRRRKSGLQQKRSDMSLQRTLRELYRVRRHASHLDSERSFRAGKRSKRQSHDVLVVHCGFRTPQCPRHIRPLSGPRKGERRRTQVGRAPSVKRDPPYHDLWNAVAAPLLSVVLSENRSIVGSGRAQSRGASVASTNSFAAKVPIFYTRSAV